MDCIFVSGFVSDEPSIRERGRGWICGDGNNVAYRRFGWTERIWTKVKVQMTTWAVSAKVKSHG